MLFVEHSMMINLIQRIFSSLQEEFVGIDVVKERKKEKPKTYTLQDPEPPKLFCEQRMITWFLGFIETGYLIMNNK